MINSVRFSYRQELKERMEQWTNIEEQMKEVHADTNIESILSEETMMEIEVQTSDGNAMMDIESNVLAQNEHHAKKPKNLMKFQCDDCGFLTDRKNALNTHRDEHCKTRRLKGLLAEKDKQCKYCLKKMTHNALRSHLRHFIKMLKSNRKPKKKEHASISLEDFMDYLHEIKT